VWISGFYAGNDGRQHLLQLQLGKVSVRYSINEQTRTLGVEHVIAPPAALNSIAWFRCNRSPVLSPSAGRPRLGLGDGGGGGLHILD
jgi:hypothetical protein